MKRLLFALTLGLLASPAPAADVGVSVSIGHPGFYGTIDIGNYYPEPEVIYVDPVTIRRPPAYIVDPLYLRVPPGQISRWHYYCGRYNACDHPVYFVRDRWYNDVYAPAWRERHHGHRHGHGHWHRGHHHGHGHRHHRH